MDCFGKEKRSQVMAAVRSHGNKNTELKLVSILRTHEITGWRRQQDLPGKPDFLFRRERLVLFVDGCFWHGCKTHLRMPIANREYWQNKIARNVVRDRANTRMLRKSGWRVLRIWEHSLKNPTLVAKRIKAGLESGLQ
jgi:DNA mismatch endonuclease (patch repair protein)